LRHLTQVFQPTLTTRGGENATPDIRVFYLFIVAPRHAAATAGHKGSRQKLTVCTVVNTTVSGGTSTVLRRTRNKLPTQIAGNVVFGGISSAHTHHRNGRLQSTVSLRRERCRCIRHRRVGGGATLTSVVHYCQSISFHGAAAAAAAAAGDYWRYFYQHEPEKYMQQKR
jgi:hypothetical protein